MSILFFNTAHVRSKIYREFGNYIGDTANEERHIRFVVVVLIERIMFYIFASCFCCRIVTQ